MTTFKSKSDNYLEKPNFNNTTELIEENETTIQKIRNILKDYENESNKTFEIDLHRENITNELKATLGLVHENPKKKLQELINSLDNWIDSTKLEMEITKNSLEELESFSAKDKINKNNISEKFHIFRESIISTLFLTDKNMKSIYFLIFTVFSWLILWVFINDYKSTGNIIDFAFWKTHLSGISKILDIWIIMFIYLIMIIPYVKYIQYYAKKCQKINFVFYIIYVGYQIILYVISYWWIFSLKLSMISSLIISIEMTRFSLKMHGYFREKILYGLSEYHLDYKDWSSIQMCLELVSIRLKN